MIKRTQLSLNRIIQPGGKLEEFFQLAADLDVQKVELRNDLPGGKVIDTYSAEEVKALTHRYGLQILTINALQHFNVGEMLPERIAELRTLAGLAETIDCHAIVLCPHNDPHDPRTQEVCFQDTVAALQAFAPVFEDHGVLGFVEPLGFEESSLQSGMTAIEAIRSSNCPCYRIVHDTFHFHLGPDSFENLETDYDILSIGLIHVSGVESRLPTAAYRDAHRVFAGTGDHLQSLRQIRILAARGYQGDISFEPFADHVHRMTLTELQTAIDNSIDYLVHS